MLPTLSPSWLRTKTSRGGHYPSRAFDQLRDSLETTRGITDNGYSLMGSEGISPSAVRQIQAPISGREAINSSSASS